MEWTYTSSGGVTWSHFHANDAYVSRRRAPPRTAGSVGDRAATGRGVHYHAAEQRPARAKHLPRLPVLSEHGQLSRSVGAARCRVTHCPARPHGGDGGGSRGEHGWPTDGDERRVMPTRRCCAG